MKKLFSMITVFLLALSMTACSELTGESTDVLQQQISDLEDETQALKDQVTELEGTIQDYKDLEMDIVFTVTTTDLDGQTISLTLGYNDSDDVSLKAVIKGFFQADVIESEYGAYINNISDMTLPYGSYVSILENGEASMVGIDDLVIDDGDSFEFQATWWDTTQQAVYEAIQLFIDNQLDNYISTSFIDYNVFLGCTDLCDDILSDVDITTYLNGLTLTTVQDYFKAIMIAKQLSDDTLVQTYLTELSSIVTTGPYGQTALGLLAFDTTESTIDYSAYQTSALSYFETNTPYDEGLDAGALSVIALSNYSLDVDVMGLITTYMNWIKDDQLATGGIKTRDVVWNDTTYPGTENAASISQVIMALLSLGYDPTGDDYTVDGNNLVTRLLQFQLEDGSFDWDLSDDITNDVTFSTPQAFLALVIYYEYSNNLNTQINPYE